MHTWKYAALCGAVIALATAACADSSRSLNPTSPSAVVTSAQTFSAGEGIAVVTGRPENPGNGHGRPENPGNGNGRPENPGRPDSPGNSDHADNPDHPAPPDHADNPGNPHDTPPGNSAHTAVQVRGVINAIVDATITVDDVVIAVPDSARIESEDGVLSFADLQVGDRVHVRGSTTTDGIVAGQINVLADESR
jgi:hypothetical protein